MKQVLQHPRTGQLRIADVPAPGVRPGKVLVQNRASVLSAGTERQMLEFGRKNLFGKALARRDVVRKVIVAARTEGPLEAFRQASARLNRDVLLGYSSSGIVVDVGDDVAGVRVGERVACCGSDVACHAERILVPPALCAAVPDSVTDEEAAFSGIGAIALHALNVARIQRGEVVVILGLGLLGQLAVQIAAASGCTVIGIDVVGDRVELARTLGAAHAFEATGPDVARRVMAIAPRGADVVAVFASAPSNVPIEAAAAIARPRGRIVVPGLVGLDLPRRIFFEKELELRVPRAWGDETVNLEVASAADLAAARDGFFPAVQNLRRFLSLVARSDVKLAPLITHRFAIDDAIDAYDLLGPSSTKSLGIVLSYAAASDSDRVRRLGTQSSRGETPPPRVGIGLIGGGAFASSTLLPILNRIGRARLVGIAGVTGAGVQSLAERFRFDYCTTDVDRVLTDPAIACVFVATRHHLHADQVIAALAHGKDVFVEKPLALTVEELAAVMKAASGSSARILVGFNRRFAPMAVQMRRSLADAIGPTLMTCRVNANPVAAEHWIRDPIEGGGRVLGEICHFVDLLQYLAASRIVEVDGRSVGRNGPALAEDVTAELTFADGSVGAIAYTTQGDRSFPRERIEAFRGGTACVIDNFRRATRTRGSRTRAWRAWGVDRGHRAEVEAFMTAVQTRQPAPVAFEEQAYSTLATICLNRAIQTGARVDVHEAWRSLTEARVDARILA